VHIQWVDRAGHSSLLRATPANWRNPAFAPDGRRLAIDIHDGQQSDLWIYEWARDGLSRLTKDPADDFKPVWTPDGRRIVFASTRADKSTPNLYWQRADGTGEVQRLTTSKNGQLPASWHPSGKFLAFTEQRSPASVPGIAGVWDLMILPLEGEEASEWKPGAPVVFLHSSFVEVEPMFSPDGRWVAYFSNESGRFEVYVRPFPGPGSKWQISTGGGAKPIWSRTRPELLYETSSEIMVVPYMVDGDSFRAEKPRLWSNGAHMIRGGGPIRSFALHPDGDRIALATAAETAQSEIKHITLIFNFLDELRRIAPVKH
jgi:serine/threonine-protein kinase